MCYKLFGDLCWAWPGILVIGAVFISLGAIFVSMFKDDINDKHR